MVARTPPKQQRKPAVMAVAPPPLSPTLLRDTVKKVDKCMARLQELQHTVAGGKKWISSARLSPGSSRSYSQTSFRGKQDSPRLKNANPRKSSPGKFPTNAAREDRKSLGCTKFIHVQTRADLSDFKVFEESKPQEDLEQEEWRRMSLPAMLLGETMGEILEASQFARNIVEAVSSKTRKPTVDDPKTPLTDRRKQNQSLEQHSELHARRKREKQVVLQTIRSEFDMLSAQRAKSRINFKASSPIQKRDCEKENCRYIAENCRYIANRVSPRNRPWARKTVLFPNPLFHSSPTSPHQNLSKTKSLVIARNRPTPHKFLTKSPPRPASKFQVKVKSHPLSISPTRATTSLVKKSPKASAAAKLRRSFSPSRLANRLVSPLKNTNYVQKNEGASATAKMRRSFSPSLLANRLVSPLKSRKSAQNGAMNIMSGLKQRPTSMSVQFSPRRT